MLVYSDAGKSASAEERRRSLLNDDKCVGSMHRRLTSAAAAGAGAVKRTIPAPPVADTSRQLVVSYL